MVVRAASRAISGTMPRRMDRLKRMRATDRAVCSEG